MAIIQYHRLQVLTAVIIKTVVCWDVTTCSMAKVYQCFRKSCYLHYQGRLYSVTAHKTAVLQFHYLSFGAKGHADVGHSGTQEESP